MIEYVKDENLSEYEAFLSAHAHGSYLQSYYWAKQNPGWRWVALIRKNSYGRITGSAALQIREYRLSILKTITCCRGPVCDDDDAETQRELLEAIRKVAKKERACFVRLDTPFTEDDVAFFNYIKRMRYKVRTHKREAPAYPKRSWVIPIHGLPWARIQNAFSPEHTQSIQIAMHHGVEIRRGSRALIPAFSELMEKAALRDNDMKPSPEYFAGLLDIFGDDARIYLAFSNEHPVSGLLMLRYGRTYTCIAQADLSNPGLRAPHLLRAAVIQTACELHCSSCEFPGLPGSKESVEYRFEQGFGGEPKVYIGETDWIRGPVRAWICRTVESFRASLAQRSYFYHIR